MQQSKTAELDNPIDADLLPANPSMP